MLWCYFLDDLYEHCSQLYTTRIRRKFFFFFGGATYLLSRKHVETIRSRAPVIERRRRTPRSYLSSGEERRRRTPRSYLSSDEETRRSRSVLRIRHRLKRGIGQAEKSRQFSEKQENRYCTNYAQRRSDLASRTHIAAKKCMIVGLSMAHWASTSSNLHTASCMTSRRRRRRRRRLRRRTN